MLYPLPADPAEPPTQAVESTGMTRTQRRTLLATGLGLFMIFLDSNIVNVALPSIQESFRVGESGLQWVVTAYSLGMSVFMMSAATLADLHGRRKLYLAGIALFTVSSAACGMAGSLEFLNISRAIQGVAAAAVTATSLAIVSATFPEPRLKAVAIGIWTAIANTATAIGPTLGGFLVQRIGWRSVFLVNVPVGLVVLLLTWRFVVESRDPRPRRFDVPGQLLLAVAIGSFAGAVIEGPRAGWLSAEILGLFALAGGTLVAFVRWERHSPDPMMELTLFRSRTYSLAVVTIFVVMFGSYGMLLVITQYLQNVREFSPIEAGLLLLPSSLATMVFSLEAGRLVGKSGSRRLILSGLVWLIVGLAIVIGGLATSTIAVVVGLVIVGAGRALSMTPSTALAVAAVPPERAGMASGIVSVQRALGSTVGFAVLGSILAAWLGATLDGHLAGAVPNASDRRDLTAAIVANANPRAYAAEIGPGRPIPQLDPTARDAVIAAADRDFVSGIRAGLGVAILLLGIILALGYRGFPRDGQRAEDLSSR